MYPTSEKWRSQWQPTPVLLPGKSHGQRSLEGCSPWGHEELDMTERLHFHFSLSCIGEGNGNPLQCSCLENPRDGEAWWAAVCGVAQSQTRLKRLGGGGGSSSERYILFLSKCYISVCPYLTTALIMRLCQASLLEVSQRHLKGSWIFQPRPSELNYPSHLANWSEAHK